MPTYSFIYSFNYNYHHSELCKLESRQIFDKEEKNKLLFSNIKVDPSISPFIKNRLEIISSSENYSELLENIKKENIHIDGFKAEYLILDGDSTGYAERLNKLRDIGYRIDGQPDYYTPSITYSICNYKNVWYFGILIKHNTDWRNHKKKPCSFSNSISINIAKTLVSIASKGNKTNQILDACCGVGTVILEACISGFNIEGCDINLKACKHTKENLSYYNYTANVYLSDIKDLNKKYDSAIIDLPYNLYTYSNDTIISNIIESTAKLTARIVIVSISDIETIIKKSGLKISDFCIVEKRGTIKFTRNIWVCEKEISAN
jgi:tRNA G10  N-methylase Trm11